MPRYRYRTAVLLGSWHDCRREALTRAVSRGLACWTSEEEDCVRWLIRGEIEECSGAPRSQFRLYG